MDWSEQPTSGAEGYQSYLVPVMFVPFGARFAEAVSEGDRVLDVACGTGAVTREAARRAGPDGSVTGVDMGEHMLAVASAQPQEPGAAPIEYLQGVAEQLPVSSGAFDVALCHHGLQFFPDRVSALREMARALVAGGQVAVACWGAIADQPHFAAIAEALDSNAGEELGDMMRAPFSVGASTLTALLTEAGFAEVEVEAVSLPVEFPDFANFARRAIGAGPIEPSFAGLPDDRQEAIVGNVREALSDHETAEGTLASSMTSLVARGVATN